MIRNENETLWEKARFYARIAVAASVIGGTALFSGCSSYEPKIKYWGEETCIHGRNYKDCPECSKHGK